MKRIGLFGGSFNPIHFGHLILAQEAKNALRLERVLFIPSHRTPLKKGEALPEARHRYKMVCLAVKGNPAFQVSNIEIRRGGTSYTIDTVRALRKSIRGAEFFLLVGSDCLKTLYTWKEAEELFRLCRFVIARRPGFPLEHVPNGFQKLEIPQVGLSSQEIRQRIHQGLSVSYQVPRPVEHYILRHKLYQ